MLMFSTWKQIIPLGEEYMHCHFLVILILMVCFIYIYILPEWSLFVTSGTENYLDLLTF